MSKIKLSFSFLLALMFVGILSTAAFAAGSSLPSYNPQVKEEGSAVKAGIQTTDTGLDNNYNTVDKSNANKTGLGVGTNDGSTSSTVIKSKDMVIDNAGTHGNQKTHGSYMNNTNSCASCHQVHTGASEGLLFKDGQYATCTACHDGTVGAGLNVFGKGSDSAGTFGGTHDGNMSAHLSDGSVKISAAPGGNNTAVAGRGGEWTEEFTCASCHAPHGSYSTSLLHEDPNGMANTLVKDGGKKLVNVPVLDSTTLSNLSTKYTAADVTYQDAAGASQTINYIVYRFNIGDSGAPTNTDYAVKGLKSGDVVLQLMKWDGSKYVIDTDPWIHEYDFDTTHTKHYWTAFSDGKSKYASDYADPAYANQSKDTFDTDQLKKGEILGAGFAGVRLDILNYPGSDNLTKTVNSLTVGKIARGYTVTLPKQGYTTVISALWDSSNPQYVKNTGVAMSTWCAACHTDYLAGSGKETGTFDHAYRHSTNSDSYTCVRCHYSHGTDVTIMRDARGLTYNDILTGQNGGANYFTNVPFNSAVGADNSAREALVKDYLLDKNPDSALKRYTNMSICWGCHTSSHSGGTRNTDTYQYDPNPGVATDRNGITSY